MTHIPDLYTEAESRTATGMDKHTPVKANGKGGSGRTLTRAAQVKEKKIQCNTNESFNQFEETYILMVHITH